MAAQICLPLVGEAYQTAAGESMCFGFSLPSGCANAQPGGKRDRGHHVCAQPGCGKNHSLVNHV